jgi:hypothetical protein
MEALEQKIAAVRREIDRAAEAAGRSGREITLCAATKVQTGDTIRAAIAAGITCCGENRVQELTAHLAEDAYAGAQVHFIGHLQRNKVKYVVGHVDLIQSVDGEELLRLIEKQAAKLDLVQDILIEVNIGGEESKSGVTPETAHTLAALAGEMEHVRLRGLMAIPPVSLEAGSNRGFFAAMHQLFIDINDQKYDNENTMDILSMGMSKDFADAIAEGATLVRVGTALFGARPANRANG